MFLSSRFKKNSQLLKNYLEVIRDFFVLRKQNKEVGWSLKWGKRKLVFSDKHLSHPIDYHYTYHPAWAARIVKKINPRKHTDISSILSFSTQLSAFVPVDFYDFRPAELELSNMNFKKANLINLQFKDNSIESLSCMHTVEHIGLGRYGDEIDIDGSIKAMKELQRVVKKGGSILFVVPVGKERIVYNAHRIFSVNTITRTFNECILNELKVVLDNPKDGLVSASVSVINNQKYACGCFWFIKQ